MPTAGTRPPFPELRFDPGRAPTRFTGRRLEGLWKKIVAAVVLGWVPLVVLGGIDLLLTGRVQSILLDISVHVRLLVAIPFLLGAEETLHRLAPVAFSRLVQEGFVVEDARLEKVVRRALRLRNARGPELVLLSVALAVGIATLVGWVSPYGVVGAEATSRLSAARLWYGIVALPIFLFLLGRSLWHWAIWIQVLGGLARLGLTLVPGHPDLRGGIGFLKLPSFAFQVLYLFAMSSVLCGSWGTRVAMGGVHVADFRPAFIVFVAIGAVFTFGPLLMFTPALLANVLITRRELGGIATDYVRAFRQRWLPVDARAELLGTPDLQSLNDLRDDFIEAGAKASAFLFSLRDMIVLTVMLALPTVPLLLAELPIEEVLQKLAQMVLGAGIP